MVKSNKKITGIYIGRFQPFHLGHLKFINFALNHVDKLRIVIASKGNDEDVFTYDERTRMITESIRDKSNLEIIGVTDQNNYDWVKNVFQYLEGRSEDFPIFTNNEKTVKAFQKYEEENKGIKFSIYGMPPTDTDDISGTMIRKKIMRGEIIEDYVTLETRQIIDEIRSPTLILSEE